MKLHVHYTVEINKNVDELNQSMDDSLKKKHCFSYLPLLEHTKSRLSSLTD